jgi:hypothetical protein
VRRRTGRRRSLLNAAGGVVAGRDEQGGGDEGVDALLSKQCRGDALHESARLGFDLGGFSVELLVATSQPP